MNLPILEEQEYQMTVADLEAKLAQVEDKTTPVFLENGVPLHYTIKHDHKFYIGVI